MAKRSKLPRLPATIPISAQKLFTHFTPVVGEDASEFEGFLAAVTDALQPRDTIEILFVRSVADHEWEIRRLRRIQASILTSETADASRVGPPNAASTHAWFSAPEEVIRMRPKDDQELAQLEREFYAKNPDKLQERVQRDREPLDLSNRGFSVDKPRKARPKKVSDSEAQSLMTAAFKRNGRELEQLGRLIALAESRRNAELRELERYRAARRANRERNDEIIDAEYTDSSE